MKLALLLTFLAPLAAHAELSLYAVNGTAEAPLAANTVFQLPAVDPGETATLRLRVRNNTSANEDITKFVALGAGFSLERPLPPQTLRPGEFMNATLTFRATLPANYNANLQMNGVSVLMLITVRAGATLTPNAPCQSDGNGVAFGIVVRGVPRTCGFTLGNQTSAAITINTMTLNGSGFSFDGGAPAVPLTLAPSQSIALNIKLDVQASGAVQGNLRIASRDYPLSAMGADPPLANPVIEYGSTAPASGQQRQVRIKLAEPAGVAASGYLDLQFTRDATSFDDDPAARFLEGHGSRVFFQVAQGASEATFNSSAFVTLQTGSTSGKLRLSLANVSSGYTGDPAVTLNLAPMPIASEGVTASRLPDNIKFTLVGFDNTFSAGQMLFRFYDAQGQQVTAAMPADFSVSFRNYFISSQGGSVFKLTVNFPLSGDGSAIVAMEADLTNSAGTFRTGRLTF